MIIQQNGLRILKKGVFLSILKPKKKSSPQSQNASEGSAPMLDNETSKKHVNSEKVFQEDAISSPKCDFKCFSRRKIT